MANSTASEPGEIIKALQSGRTEVLEALYAQHREDFFRWAGRRFQGNMGDYEDAWQDAVIAFYEQVTSGRVTALRSGLRTWLFAVGCKRLLQNNRKMKRFFWKDAVDLALLRDAQLSEFEWDIPRAEEKALLERSMGVLSSQCREILIQRFYEGKKLPEIREALNYNSENTASAALSRCLSKLKDIVAVLAGNPKQTGNGG
ncbi:MAG: sigma-70 family RNA polymerase sigma factor [Lewinellaceae bacterium]|nr:sigma-70 family RNA polymerase sigma factor [Lewinellaceae bacterium]